VSEFDWSVQGMDFAKMLNPDKATAAMKRGLSRGLKVVTNQVKVETPVDTGELRASITDEVRVEGNVIVGVVGTVVGYAPHVEFGTAPHFPPPAALAGWARRHGVNPFLVARAIAKRGTKAHRMFGKVLESPFVSGIVERFVSDDLRKAIWG
jgi:hypothetical protein